MHQTSMAPRVIIGANTEIVAIRGDSILEVGSDLLPNNPPRLTRWAKRANKPKTKIRTARTRNSTDVEPAGSSHRQGKGQTCVGNIDRSSYLVEVYYPTRVKVSSEVLCNASLIFQALLRSGFQESELKLRARRSPILRLPEDDPETMLLFCRILHSTTSIQDLHDYDTIHGIVALCDKYNVLGVVKPYVYTQLERLLTPDRNSFDRQLLTQEGIDFEHIIKLCWMMDLSDFFKLATKAFYLHNCPRDVLLKLHRAFGEHYVPDHLSETLEACSTNCAKRLLNNPVTEDIFSEAVARVIDYPDRKAIWDSFDMRKGKELGICEGLSRRVVFLRNAALPLRPTDDSNALSSQVPVQILENMRQLLDWCRIEGWKEKSFLCSGYWGCHCIRIMTPMWLRNQLGDLIHERFVGLCLRCTKGGCAQSTVCWWQECRACADGHMA